MLLLLHALIPCFDACILPSSPVLLHIKCKKHFIKMLNDVGMVVPKKQDCNDPSGA